VGFQRVNNIILIVEININMRIEEEIMRIASEKGMFTPALLGRRLNGKFDSVKIVDATHKLVSEGKLRKIVSGNGNGSGGFLLSCDWNLDYDSTRKNALELRQYPLSQEGCLSSCCSDAYEKMVASKIEKEQDVVRKEAKDAHDMENLKKSKNLTNTHLLDLFS
jgi:hypothetical protein